MQKFYKYANLIISLDFPEEIDLIQLKQHLPSFDLFNHFHISNSIIPDIFISFIESNNSDIIFDLNFLNLYDQWNASYHTDLPHLLYSYLKYVLFHRQIYSVHSCLIHTTLFIGHSGSGKTSLCTNALQKNKSISSYDRTLLEFNNNNNLNFIHGTDILSVRSQENLPILPALSFNHDRISYQVDHEKSCLIDKIILFQISENEKTILIKDLSLVHQLLPFFIDSIKSDCFIQNGKLLFTPTYSESIKKILFNDLRTLNTKVYFVSGSIDFLTNLSDKKL